MNRADLQQLAKERIADARALLAARRWSAAYYLAGYAVECALKACIAKRVKAEEFPDRSLADKCWTHNLLQLLGLTGLKDGFEAAMSSDSSLKDNWEIVKEWSEASRYATKSKPDAANLIEAITNSKHGVLTWLKPHC